MAEKENKAKDKKKPIEKASKCFPFVNKKKEQKQINYYNVCKD